MNSSLVECKILSSILRDAARCIGLSLSTRDAFTGAARLAVDQDKSVSLFSEK